MILTIVHTGLKGFFLKGKALPASLQEHHDGLCYWLSVLHAATCPDDLKLAGSKLTKGKPGYRWTVAGVGEFTFLITNRDIESLNFKQA